MEDELGINAVDINKLIHLGDIVTRDRLSTEMWLVTDLDETQVELTRLWNGEAEWVLRSDNPWHFRVCAEGAVPHYRKNVFAR